MSRKIVAIFTKGALTNVEETREALAVGGPVEIQPGYDFEIARYDSNEKLSLLFAAGAFDNVEAVREELNSRNPALIEINPGYQGSVRLFSAEPVSGC